MTPELAPLLDDIRRAGVEMEVRGDRLHLRAPVPPPDDLLRRIRQSKPALLAVIRRPARRAIVRFRMSGDLANAWATAIAPPGVTAEAMIEDLRFRHGNRIEIGELRA